MCFKAVLCDELVFFKKKSVSVKNPVAIKNKPKNIFQCIWLFLTH